MKSIFLSMVEEHQKEKVGDPRVNGLGVFIFV